jgi:hypothetical protein
LGSGGRVAESEPADRGAHHRFQVDESAGQLGRDPGLPVGEQPEGPDRAHHHERHERRRCRRPGGRRRQATGDQRGGKREQPGRGELDRGHCRSVLAVEESGLQDDEDRGERDRRQHEQITGTTGAVAAGARDHRDAPEGDAVTGPGARTRDAVPERRGDDRHEHRNRADDDGCVAHARACDPGVLEHHHRAKPDRSAQHDPPLQRIAQAAAPGHGQDRRGA